MIKIEQIDERLMITTTDDPTKALHKVGTEEVYSEEAIDVIKGFRDGVPYCRFIYEEIDSPFEVEENIEEV